MSTIEATVSMLETMPEEARTMVIGMGEQPGKHGTYPGFLHLMGKFRGKALAMDVSHQNAAIYLKETE